MQEEAYKDSEEKELEGIFDQLLTGSNDISTNDQAQAICPTLTGDMEQIVLSVMGE